MKPSSPWILNVACEALGYDVVATAGTGPQAIRLASEHRPDLVLMDIRLQGPMDGVEAGREIRERFQVPIVFLTAYADESTVKRAKVAEPLGYLLKPFEDRQLHTAIAIALHKCKAEAIALHQAGEALWQSQQRFQLLVESLSDYAVVALVQAASSPGTRARSALPADSPEEAIGQHCSLFYRAEEVVANKPDQLLWTAAHHGRAAEQGLCLRKDGSRFWGDTVITALADQKGELAGFARITRM